MHKFKLALLQTKCVINKSSNIQYIIQSLQKAGKNGAQVTVLGQVCNSPYMKQYMLDYAEDFTNSPTLQAIKKQCLNYKMYTIGSITRKQSNKYYNTAFVINPQGKLQNQMDKIHLFDIDIPGKITYKQSQAFTAGSNICVFDTQFCKFGLAICYDLRFAELGLLMAQKGARILLYPGSFNQTTGPLHWQLLLRGRALDTQCFCVGVSAAQCKQSPELYQAWGHSCAVDPFGKVLGQLNEQPGISYFDIDPNYTEEIRTQIPLRMQRRKDIYKLDLI